MRGTFTAIVTPFDKNGEVDEEGLRRNVDFQIENGICGIVPVGTTGESATLTAEEHKHVIEIVVDHVAGRVPVVAGTGSNSTAESIEYTQHALDAGADAALMISPYYNKPTQEGIYQHFKKVAESVDIPIILYTVPSRTVVNIEAPTTIRLSKIPNIIGIKDASGDLDQITRVLTECPGFLVFSGDDSLNFPTIVLGAHGAISVASNVAPRLVSDAVTAALKGDIKEARRLHNMLHPLYKVLFIETSPSPVKAAMKMMGAPAGDPRLPLVQMSEDGKKKLRKVLADLDLI
ncbi:MAG: 4-hydroxy-tetrahydrodipicolinate synthase [Candidatus Altiarchaeales archaeon IMC4]|nr:MAG: 4-hydroxy-tetrahydrodipicolinate synthase [Candidatus Altiarchaeales archaeon IMC4]